jgi:diguanylate cyclase (GGDEF)-like protein
MRIALPGVRVALERWRASPLAVALTAGVGLVLVGVVDYVTGIEIRIFPLYFLPLMLAAWHLRRRTTLLFALAADAIWLASLYAGGREYTHAYVWPINFLTQGSAFLLVSLLVGGLRAAIGRERALARSDALTGLPNRLGFREPAGAVVELCHRHGRAVTLAYLDLDNFKRANDTLGHAHGDALLKTTARTLSQNLRSMDIAGRLGGDEFVVLLPETGAEAAQGVLERIRSGLAEDAEFRLCAVTASIGAVAFDAAPGALEAILAAADRLMYEVKKSSKNRVLVERVEATPQRPIA